MGKQMSVWKEKLKSSILLTRKYIYIYRERVLKNRKGNGMREYGT